MSALLAPVRLAERLTTAERFRKLAAEWKEQSQYMSNTTTMAMLRPYQAIIGMGLPVVPLILEALRDDPDHWFWALEVITDANPIPDDAKGVVSVMREAWLNWGREQGLLA